MVSTNVVMPPVDGFANLATQAAGLAAQRAVESVNARLAALSTVAVARHAAAIAEAQRNAARAMQPLVEQANARIAALSTVAIARHAAAIAEAQRNAARAMQPLVEQANARIAALSTVAIARQAAAVIAALAETQGESEVQLAEPGERTKSAEQLLDDLLVLVVWTLIIFVLMTGTLVLHRDPELRSSVNEWTGVAAPLAPLIAYIIRETRRL